MRGRDIGAHRMRRAPAIVLEISRPLRRHSGGRVN
jgi:hypothetical protein